MNKTISSSSVSFKKHHQMEAKDDQGYKSRLFMGKAPLKWPFSFFVRISHLISISCRDRKLEVQSWQSMQSRLILVGPHKLYRVVFRE